MAQPGEHLDEAFPDRYRIERELGRGGMACRSRAEATTRQLSLKRRGLRRVSHFSDINRVAASAAGRRVRNAAERSV